MLWRLISGLWKREYGAGRAADGVNRTAGLHAATRPLACDSLMRGRLLQKNGELEAALACYRAHADLHPNDLAAREAIADVLSASWRIDECIEACSEGLALAPRNAAIFSCYLLYSHYASHPDARRLADLHRGYGALMAETAPPLYENYPAIAPDSERRLRIGYVSGDFCQHSVASFIAPVLEHHDHERFEIYCYYTRAYRDSLTERFARLANVWRDVHALDAPALAVRIHDDAIDILIDLGGHTFGSALPVFARRPAPLQVTWLGYPDTSGLHTMDYRITDEIADPPPIAETLHSEQLLRLDPPFLCYAPPRESPAPRPRSGPVVFGSFNVIMKVNKPLIELWARILHGASDSRMLLKSKLLENTETCERLRAAFEAHGIAGERIDLRPWADDRTAHFAAYNEIDIALDTFPYNGTTTTCEALWMGTPVVSLAGGMHMSRVGATLLASVGLRDLVAQTPDEYVDIAIAMARDAARRTAIGRTLRDGLSASPLLDHPAFARRLEKSLRAVWIDWCAKHSR